MLNWIKSKLAPKKDDTTTMHALPIEVNAAANAPVEVPLQRALGRLLNLYSVQNPNSDVLLAIENYKGAVAHYGRSAPMNFDEVEQLIRLTKE